MRPSGQLTNVLVLKNLFLALVLIFFFVLRGKGLCNFVEIIMEKFVTKYLEILGQWFRNSSNSLRMQ